uniref:Uncharacterized protein n=1 Tax=Anguilla anguilla TaxID=7936 RepID=A0A0E9QFC2_ANGAN
MHQVKKSQDRSCCIARLLRGSINASQQTQM